MKKIIRITTIPGSFLTLLTGQLKYMSKYYDMMAVSSKGEMYEGRYLLDKVRVDEGVKTKGVEMTRRITPFKDLRAIWKLYRVFKQEKPQLVHSHTPKAGTLAMIAAKLAGVPHRWHTIAGLPLLEIEGAKRILLNFVEKLTYSSATKILPNSYGLREIILQHKFTNKDKLKVVGNGSSNGIDTSYFNAKIFSEKEKRKLKKSLGITSKDFVFIFMGRLVKDKGINELIGAFKNISTNYSNIKLLLLGTYEKLLDPLLPEIENEITHNPNIINTGWVKDVRPYLSISNTLVFPSYREGFPNTVMQAAAMDLPCIVSDINGCNEIITDGENGIIIPVKNQQVIEEAMSLILTDEKYRLRLTQNSRRLICEKYERQYVWEELLENYQLVLN